MKLISSKDLAMIKRFAVWAIGWIVFVVVMVLCALALWVLTGGTTGR